MEPPANRMRIWQSVEVDEENVEYIKAKQKQQQKFKGRLESIFEKYGNMHESMSDEIDMTTNRVVVDRGHLRRLKRQVGRKETILLDTLGLAAEKEPEQGSEEEENGEESADELAPTQPEKSDGQPELDGQGPKIPDHNAQSPRSNNVSSASQPTNDTTTSIPYVGTMQGPNTPNPTSNILPLVQFPQTPAGQQAQSTFYLTLTQGISEVIQKAMAQSGLLPPNFQSPFANTVPLPTTPITTADRIAPATDPRWFFPPLSATRQSPVAQSSPLPAGPPAEQVDQATSTALPYEPQGQVLAESTPQINEASPMVVSRAMLEASSPTRCRRTSPRVEIQKRRIRPARKYSFTSEDDTYLSKKKMVDQLPWAAIKESREKWKDWPVSALSRRWAVIKDQNLHLQAPVLARPGDIDDVDHGLEEQTQTLPQSHHLPTPSSSEHEDGQKAEPTENANEFPSSAIFDDDERELLSLAGTDVEDEDENEDQDQDENEDHLPNDEEAPDLISEDSVMPSIETPDLPIEEPSGLIEEDDLQRELLENLPMQNATITPPRQPSVQTKTEPTSHSPIITRTQDALPRHFETVPDSDSLEDTTNNSPPHQPTPSFVHCPICDRAFESLQALARHTANPRNTHTHLAPSVLGISPSRDLTITGDDDLLPAPSTPIKREPNTPSSRSFFVSGFQTPKAGDMRRINFAQGEQDMGRRSEKKLSVKQLKRCWKGTAGTPVASAKKGKRGRESFGAEVVGRSVKKIKLGGLGERSESEERDELCF